MAETRPHRFWLEMTTEDFRAADTSSWIAVLPVAAIEQHGPHLPLGVDTIIAEGHVTRAAALVPVDLPAVFLPVQAVGKSNEHLAYPGTVTLGWASAMKAWLDIGDSVARAGIRKIALVTSHGGNVALLDIIARELRVKHRMLAVATAWARFGQPEGLYSPRERSYGIHGGDMETSLMLHLRPDLVRMDRVRDFASAQERHVETFAHLRAHGGSAYGWQAQDLNPAGTVGEADRASAEKGHASLEHAANAFARLLGDMHAFDVSSLH